MEEGLPEEDTEYSIRGTKLHGYFRMDQILRSDLCVDDLDLLKRADRLSDEVVQNFMMSVGLSPDEEVNEHHEVEMHGLVPGHADSILTWRRGNYACVLDLKSGVRPADDAPDNWQLAAYALLQFDRKPFEACCVAIIQPDAFGKRVTTAIYRHSDMPAVANEIRAIVDATQDPDAQAVAGPQQCLYCRAKTTCPAYREKFMAVDLVRARAVSTLDNEQLVRVHQAIQFANKIQKEVAQELRDRIRSGSLPGKLRNTGSTRDLTHPSELWMVLQERYGHIPTFASRYDACRKLSFGAFESLIQELEGCTGKRASEIAKELVAPFCSETPKEPTPIPEL